MEIRSFKIIVEFFLSTDCLAGSRFFGDRGFHSAVPLIVLVLRNFFLIYKLANFRLLYVSWCLISTYTISV